MSSRLVALLIAIAITTRWANAQSTFGTIVGVVKDPGELVVQGPRSSFRAWMISPSERRPPTRMEPSSS